MRQRTTRTAPPSPRSSSRKRPQHYPRESWAAPAACLPARAAHAPRPRTCRSSRGRARVHHQLRQVAVSQGEDGVVAAGGAQAPRRQRAAVERAAKTGLIRAASALYIYQAAAFIVEAPAAQGGCSCL